VVLAEWVLSICTNKATDTEGNN